MRVLLISTYELGRPPTQIATPAAALISAGHAVRCIDISLQDLELDDIDWADKIAFSVPMHTAMRLALEASAVVRERKPEIPICFYGLYATMSTEASLKSELDAVIAGEYENGLVAWVGGDDHGEAIQLKRSPSTLPARYLLAPVERYASLIFDDQRFVSASVSTSRGCSHRCRHCPVPVIYNGRVRTIDEDTILKDIDQLASNGVQHISYDDPDFLNTPLHAQRVIERVHHDFPHLTFDCTVKVEHILRYLEIIPKLSKAGCLFVISAFESTNDKILAYLDKGHTVQDESKAVIAMRNHGIEIRPSWLPFTPWTTNNDLIDIMSFVRSHDLIANVDPIQYTIRLLLPQGSLLLEQASMRQFIGPYDPDRLSWTWTNPDKAIDKLQLELVEIAERYVDGDPIEAFYEMDSLINSKSSIKSDGPGVLDGPNGLDGPGVLDGPDVLDGPGVSIPTYISKGAVRSRPRLSESWFCCSEPTDAQRRPVSIG